MHLRVIVRDMSWAVGPWDVASRGLRAATSRECPAGLQRVINRPKVSALSRRMEDLG
jgi:hypothetical protein